MGATVRVPVKAGELTLFALMDEEEVERLGDRSLALGPHGYAQLCDGTYLDRTVLLHRWVMGAERRDGRIVDHINGNQLDCRKVNLRFVTASESSSNVRARSASGYRGVARMRSKWQAHGKLGGRQYHLGTYDTPEEAAQVAHIWRLENLPGYTGRDIAVSRPSKAA